MLKQQGQKGIHASTNLTQQHLVLLVTYYQHCYSTITKQCTPEKSFFKGLIPAAGFGIVL